jgi:hypothetical protein
LTINRGLVHKQSNFIEMLTVIDVSDIFKDGIQKIRTTPGGKVSGIDYVMIVTNKNNNRAAECIANIKTTDPTFFSNLEKYKFPGPGQTSIYVLCASEAIELLMILPGNRAKAFRKESAELLTRLFSGDPTLQDLLKKNGLIANTMDAFLGHLQEVAPAVLATVGPDTGSESEAHETCKYWIAANLNNITFAAVICPGCKIPVVGLSLNGGDAFVEQRIPHTDYRADVLVKLPTSNTWVAVEVAHTHFTSGKRMFECEERGTITCEVETCEVQSAILRHSPDSNHILRTTRTRSVLCAACGVE